MTLVCVRLRKITNTEDLVFLRHYAYPGLTEENEPLSISLAGQDPGRERHMWVRSAVGTVKTRQVLELRHRPSAGNSVQCCGGDMDAASFFHGKGHISPC